MLRVGVWAIAFAALLAVTRVEATPFTYDETTGGDLPADQQVVPVFVLGAGSNTVRGTEFLAAFPSFLLQDVDQFGFSVPTGYMLSKITFSYQASISGSTSSLNAIYELHDGLSGPPDVTMLAQQNIFFFATPAGNITPSPSDVFSTAFPLETGTYMLLHGQSGAIGPTGSNSGGSWNYEWQFEVVAVPEPTGLFALGLAGLVLLGRRRNPTARISSVMA